MAELPQLRHLAGEPSYEVTYFEGFWGWSIETATENWNRWHYGTREAAAAGAWEHAAEHFAVEAVRRIEFRCREWDLQAWRSAAPRERPPCRRMSFFLTKAQILDGSKTVTRRNVNTWTTIRPGDRILAIEKGQGLRAGEGHHVLALLEVVDVRLELLTDITAEDCAREGFPEMTPAEFVAFYRRAAKGGAR